MTFIEITGLIIIATICIHAIVDRICRCVERINNYSGKGLTYYNVESRKETDREREKSGDENV